MTYGMVTLLDGTRVEMWYESAQPARKIGDVIYWSADNYVPPVKIVEVIELAPTSYTRCNDGRIGTWHNWGYKLEDC